MITATRFLEHSQCLGFRYYSFVPCSFLTPVIDGVLSDAKIHCISSANEGDAVAFAAGTAIGGVKTIAMMQNSGLGNAISPLTSLVDTFRIPLLLIITLRGDPSSQDEPQHRLMGKITTSLLEQMGIRWSYFPTEEKACLSLLDTVTSSLCEKNPSCYAMVLRKGSIHPGEKAVFNSEPFASHSSVEKVQKIGKKREKNLPTRNEILRYIVEYTNVKNTVIITTTGYTSRELFALADRPNHLYMVGSMGCVSSLGLGLSLARPDLKIFVIDGDGAALMRMGNFATIGHYGKSNLTHILLDNNMHESTGGQYTTSISFAMVAQACGYPLSLEGEPFAVLDSLLQGGLCHEKGPRFGHIVTRSGTTPNLPRPTLAPYEVKERLITHIDCL